MADRDQFIKFIVDVSKNPERLRQVKKDPDGTMAAAGLSAEQIAALKSLDPDRIRAAALGPNAAANDKPNIVFAIVAVIKF